MLCHLHITQMWLSQCSNMCCTSWDLRLSQWWKWKIVVLWVLIFVGGWVSGTASKRVREWVDKVGWGETGVWVVSKHFQGTQYLHLQGSRSLWAIAQQATFLGLLDLWRSWHYIPFQWHSVTSQKAWILSSTAMRTSKLAQYKGT